MGAGLGQLTGGAGADVIATADGDQIADFVSRLTGCGYRPVRAVFRLCCW